MKLCMTRRAALVASSQFLLAAAASSVGVRPEKPPKFQIGACDWSIGKLADVTGLELAKRIGLDGLQVSLGTAKDDMKLRQPSVRKEYLDAARRHGVQIASLAIGELNNIPFKSDPRAEEWVQDSIDVSTALGTRVVLIAFFHHGDLRNDKPGVEETIRRFKRVAAKAEKAGVTLGIESWLSAGDHAAILDAVDSPAIKVYYDVANSHQMGYDIYEEIPWLGKERICEFHMKENGQLLGKGPVDFEKVRKAMDAIGYGGWMQIEGAVPPGQPLFESYVENRKFLRSIF